MNRKIITIAGSFMILLAACYNNKEDILSLPKVSFRKEIVPIVTAGACGCHNNGQTRAIQFSHLDTVWYDAILARRTLLDSWVKGGAHPGGGEIDFGPSEKLLIKRWLDEGGQDDGSGCAVNGAITFANNIQAIYSTTCKGATCHGGIAVALDYTRLVADQTILSQMVSSSGRQGHPGGALSLSICTINTLKAWLDQGQPK